MNRSVLATLLAGAVLFVGCQKHHDHPHGSTTQHAMRGGGAIRANMMATSAVAEIAPSRAATTQPSMNNVTGRVTFTQQGERVKVVADLKGLTPNTTHGFHVHEKGDLSAPDLSSAGPHFNPGGHPHGAPGSQEVHVGDLGNIKSDAQGNAHLEMDSPLIKLDGENSIIGKSVIVHAKPDDLRTQPSGDAGGRIAGGIIKAGQ